MRDALGGTVNIIIIVMFIVIALGYITFNINYTKAFRVNDKIVSLYEQNKGNCGSASTCATQIKEYAHNLGYQTDLDFSCPSGFTKQDNIYCLKTVDVRNNGGIDEVKAEYYIIVTKTKFSIPIINNIMDLEVFSVRGSTKTIYKNR